MPTTPLGIPTPPDSTKVSGFTASVRVGFDKVDELIRGLSDPDHNYGYIDTPTDANTMRGIDWSGNWTIYHHDAANAPELPEGADPVWLVKIRQASAAVTEQTWVRTDTLKTWVRLARTNTTWEPYTQPFWPKGRLDISLYPSLDDIPQGFHEVWTAADATALGLPVPYLGTLTKYAYGSVQHFTYQTNYQGQTRLFTTSKTAGSDADWTDLSWSKGKASTDIYPTLDDIPEGYHQIWTAADATAYELPDIGVGELHVHHYGSVRHISFTRFAEGRMRLFMTSKATGVSPTWNEIGADPDPSNVIGLTPATSRGYKSVGIPCSLGQGVNTTTGQGFARFLQRMPATATRARVRIRNINPRWETPDSDPITLTNVSIGPRAAGAQNATSWTTIDAAADTGTEGYVSPWIMVPDEMQGSDIFVGFGWECSGTVQQTLATVYTGANAADALTGTGTRGTMAPAFVTLEVEVPNATPVVANFADSIGSGVGSVAPIYYSWLDQYAAAKGIVATHWSHSGDSAATWQNPASPKWSLYGDQIAAADAVLYAMGSNDIFPATTPTLAEMQERTRTAVAIMRRMISPNVYALTITPRDGVTGAAEDLRRQYNAWLPESGLFRDVFDVVPAVSADDETLDPALTTDGIHFNATGYAAMAAAIDRPITV